MSTGPMASPGQLTAIAASLNERGVKDRPHRLAVLSYIQGRELTTMKDLERDEAGRVLGYLDSLPTGAPDTAAFVESHRPPVSP